jgi:hypothetical protein
MEEKWFYVEGKDRVGPVCEQKILDMIAEGKLQENDYVWKKGFDNWRKLYDVPELIMSIHDNQTAEISLSDFKNDQSSDQENSYESAAEVESAPEPENNSLEHNFSWQNLDQTSPIFSIKVGLDRSGDPAEYGPYSMKILIDLFKQNRINEKTYVFAPGMDEWTFLGDLPVYQELFSNNPPVIEDSDRRVHTRKPFLARMLFHDTNIVYEGVCRDISVGGMQVLVKGFPGRQGESISVNVHPDNTSFHFSADAEIVRVLEAGQGISFRFKNLSQDARMAIEKYISKDVH